MKNNFNHRNITANPLKIQNAHTGQRVPHCALCGKPVSKPVAVPFQWANQPYYMHHDCGKGNKELQGLLNVDGLQWRLLLDTVEGMEFDAETVGRAYVGSHLHMYETKKGAIKFSSDWRGNFCKVDVILQGIYSHEFHDGIVVQIACTNWKGKADARALISLFSALQETFIGVKYNGLYSCMDIVVKGNTDTLELSRGLFLLKAIGKIVNDRVGGSIEQRLAEKRIVRAVEMHREGIATYFKRLK